MLLLDSGRRVAASVGGGRIQVYDAEGKYLNGWFVPNAGVRFAIDGTGGGDTVRVELSRPDRLALYDLNGQLLKEEPVPEHFKPGLNGRFQTMSFNTPWYKWPLTDPGNAWSVGMIGLVLTGGLAVLTDYLGRLEAGRDQAPPGSGPRTVNGRPALLDDQLEARRRKVIFRVILGLAAVILVGWLARAKFGLSLNAIATIFFCVLVLGGLIGGHAYQALKGGKSDSGSPDSPATAARPGRHSAENRGLVSDRPVAVSSAAYRNSALQGGAVLARKTSLVKKIIMMAVPALIWIYGILSFTCPFWAPALVPGGWQWPMPPRHRALLLDSGERAAIQTNARRLQVYDAAGKYLQGWYIGVNSDFVGLAGGPDDFGGREALAVRTNSGRKVVYDLQGNVLSQEELPDYAPLPESGRFVDMSFKRSILGWPLYNPIVGWFMIAIGMFSFVGMAGVVRALDP